MRRFIVLTAALLTGCAYNFSSSVLNGLSLGATKHEFVQRYTISGMQGPVTRASKMAGSDTIEVLSLTLDEPNHAHADYWFVFRNSRLEQWGRPEDWRPVAARYEISWNPGARAP